MLEGFDHDWAQAESAHLASYTNLPPGNFRFRVVAFDTTHPELKSEASVGIVKQKYYYQTWWFRCGCVLLVLALVFLGYRVHVQRIKAESTPRLKSGQGSRVKCMTQLFRAVLASLFCSKR